MCTIYLWFCLKFCQFLQFGTCSTICSFLWQSSVICMGVSFITKTLCFHEMCHCCSAVFLWNIFFCWGGAETVMTDWLIIYVCFDMFSCETDIQTQLSDWSACLCLRHAQLGCCWSWKLSVHFCTLFVFIGSSSKTSSTWVMDTSSIHFPSTLSLKTMRTIHSFLLSLSLSIALSSHPIFKPLARESGFFL